MGTNFYLYEEKPCPTCSHAKEPRHIGKSSAGWNFALRVYPKEGINNIADWRALLSNPDAEILDEYGDIVSPEQMMKHITGRASGLRRHPIDRFCVGHGEGTYDYMIGAFS